jgi:hypothetical protein
VLNPIGEQLLERRNLLVGKIELYPSDAGYHRTLLGRIVEVVGSPVKPNGEVSQL